jgi:hypothetical protein
MLDEEDKTVYEGLGVLEAGAGDEALRVGERFLIPAHTGVTRQAHDDIWHHTHHTDTRSSNSWALLYSAIAHTSLSSWAQRLKVRCTALTFRV